MPRRFPKRRVSSTNVFQRVLRPDGSVLWLGTTYRIVPEADQGWKELVGKVIEGRVSVLEYDKALIGAIGTNPLHGKWYRADEVKDE